ncbi:hypothetical protein ASPBRDRAFT_201546 [Aspergillus brasiliensis CBS 101740]|uniref:Aminotransferase class I/classII large domain-containing protein n=1 Tax=Aspergillus brasiliensis (strain CBS 101740 / IMI 381727 / IBT 21946) TaxID=767769 RepID=A0A1L9U295_ASPBC|nr:hypothetical protein ASPBRDRAFT_201546 [Aspergillus brasiliensis CBS 101740]
MGSVFSSRSSNDVFSVRGRDAVEKGAKRVVWDIISDLWHDQLNPSGFVSVGMAENTLLHDELLEYIQANARFSPRHLTYNDGSMGSKELRTAVSHFVNRHFNPFRPVEPQHILMTNGCSSAIEQLSWTFLNPGEAVLLGKPYYSTFIPDISLRPEAIVVPVEFGDLDPLSPKVIDRYDRAAADFEARTGRRVRAVMLCNPHNPLGRCYPRATITGLMKLCQRRQMHLISDEIYALSVWENRVDKNCTFYPFESVLSRDTTGLIEANLVHVLWGMSKDFGANGLRIGAIISQSNPDLHVAQRSLSLYTFVSGFSDQITASILRDDDFTDLYIKTNQKKLSDAHEFFVRMLKQHGIEYATGANAGFFLWINLGKKYMERHAGEEATASDITDIIHQRLLDNRVYLAHGTAYGATQPGWFRVVFSHPSAWLEEAMERIVKAVQ